MLSSKPPRLITVSEFFSAVKGREKLHIVDDASIYMMRSVFADPRSWKIQALAWTCRDFRDQNPITLAPLFLALETLKIRINDHSEVDFVSALLEEGGSMLQQLDLTFNRWGCDEARFFVALQTSRVRHFKIELAHSKPQCIDGLCAFLRGDQLEHFAVGSLTVFMIPKVVAALSYCVRLKELAFSRMRLQDLTLPKCVTRLSLMAVQCERPLVFPGLEELEVTDCRDLVIAAPDLKVLTMKLCVFARHPFLFENFPKLHTLDVMKCTPDLIFMVHLADQIMRGWLRVLRLPYGHTDLVATCLVPVLKHPGCALVKLEFESLGARPTAFARMVTGDFRTRVGMFALLLARNKPHRKLRRLPVEMFRLVGQML